MSNEGRIPKKTAVLLIVAGLAIFLVYLYFFVPRNEVVSAFEDANPFYYSMAFASLLLSVVFSSLTWQRLLGILSVRAKLLKAFQFIWVGYFVDLLIPGESVSSDISKIYLMSKQSGQSAGSVTASVIGHRVLSTIISFGGLLITAVYFVLRYRPTEVVLGFLGIIIALGTIVLVALFYFSTHRGVTERLANWVINFIARVSRGRWRPEGLRESATKFLDGFHTGIEILGAKPKALLLPILTALLAWFFDLLIVILVFYSLGTLGGQVSLSVIAIVYFIVMGIEDIPIFIPAGVGIMEIVMTNLYGFFGVQIGLAVAATVLIRVMTFWVKLLIGGLTVHWLSIEALTS